MTTTSNTPTLPRTDAGGDVRGHTSGPWHTAFEEGPKIKDAGENTLAWLQQTHLRGKRSEREVAANARLISAAPDLLAALEMVRSIIVEGAAVGFNPMDGGDWAERLYLSQRDTSQAVRKAGGEVHPGANEPSP